MLFSSLAFFFFNDTATTEIYTLSLHDALPIYLQNLPRGDIVRSIFLPDNGKVFVNADLSQAEARVVAYLAEEKRLQTLFEQAGDIHKTIASMVFRKAFTEVTQGERQLAKTLVHAANYGIGIRKLAGLLGTAESRARELLNQYYATYPRIKVWHFDVEAQLRKSRLFTTPLGRKRMFFGRWSPDLIREAIAYVPQSTVSDVMNLGIIRAFPNLPPGWEMVMQIHDSVLFQVPIETDAMHIYKFCKHYFEITLNIHKVKFTIPIDLKLGKTWADMKNLEV